MSVQCAKITPLSFVLDNYGRSVITKGCVILKAVHPTFYRRVYGLSGPRPNINSKMYAPDFFTTTEHSGASVPFPALEISTETDAASGRPQLMLYIVGKLNCVTNVQ